MTGRDCPAWRAPRDRPCGSHDRGRLFVLRDHRWSDAARGNGKTRKLSRKTKRIHPATYRVGGAR